MPEPDRATADPQALRALETLAPRLLAVAVISGRALDDLRSRLPVPGLRFLGDYGLEQPSASDLEALRAFNQDAERLLASQTGIRLERKPGSTSVHFRSRPEAGSELQRRLAPLAAARGLQLRPGRLVVEAMPASANKEAALRRLIDSLDPGAVIWSGDDSGDRGCFELVAGLDLPHLAVGVASTEAPAGLFDGCDLVVEGPAGNARLLSLLAGWASRAAADRAGRGSGG